APHVVPRVMPRANLFLRSLQRRSSLPRTLQFVLSILKIKFRTRSHHHGSNQLFYFLRSNLRFRPVQTNEINRWKMLSQSPEQTVLPVPTFKATYFNLRHQLHRNRRKRRLWHQWNTSATRSSNFYTTCPFIRTSPETYPNNQLQEHRARTLYLATNLGFRHEIPTIHAGIRHQRTRHRQTQHRRILVPRAQVRHKFDSLASTLSVNLSYPEKSTRSPRISS